MKSLIIGLILFPIALFAAQIDGLTQKLDTLGFSKYAFSPVKKTLKIAVLDKGFEGYASEIGKSLPAKTIYHAGPVPAPADLKETHGLRMAQILTQTLTLEGSGNQFQPELHLYNVFGFTNFQAAIADLIANKVDLVLYSEVWEFGGNFDGDGFINKEVNKATKAGVIWINAAGNFHLSTYTNLIKTEKDQFLKLPNENNALKVVCPENPQKKCRWKIVLSWNDFKTADGGTNKDLDVALTDDFMNVLHKSELKQSNDPTEAKPGFTKFPREIIITDALPTGTYYLRIKNRSDNFSSNDIFRVTVDGDFVGMPSRSTAESLLNPADNETVVTVGALDSDRSSVSVRLGKPDILAPSQLSFEGVEYLGSSNAAAIVAAGFALVKSLRPELGQAEILSLVRRNPLDWNRRGLSLNALFFAPTGPQCFQAANFPSLPAHLQKVLDRGGLFVHTTLGARIMVPFDPITLTTGVRRVQANDIVLASPAGIRVIPRQSSPVGPEEVEVFQRPIEAGPCQIPASTGASFGLP